MSGSALGTQAVDHVSQFEDLQLYLLASSIVLATKTVQWPSVFPDPLLAKTSSSQADSGLTLSRCLFLCSFSVSLSSFWLQ